MSQTVLCEYQRINDLPLNVRVTSAKNRHSHKPWRTKRRTGLDFNFMPME